MAGLGAHYLQLGDLEQAETWLTKASVRDLSKVWFHLVRLYTARGDEEQGRVWVEKAAHAQVPEAIAVEGEMEWQRGDAEAAQEWWAKLPALEGPDVATAMTLVGEFLVNAGETDKGELWLLLAADLSHTVAMRDLVDLYLARGDSEAAARWSARTADVEADRT